VLADKKGIPPLSVVITAANTHDMKATAETLDCIVIKRPLPPPKKKKQQQNLCLDKGYNYPQTEHEVVKRGYVPHIRDRCEGKKSVKKKKRHHTTRRWVIERTNSWHNRFRKLLVRYEKKTENYLGLYICLAA
jgi:putative transposase